MSEIKVKETKKSHLSPFKTIIFLVNPNIVGTCEATKEEHTKKIDLSKGWNGPAIAVVGYKDDSLYKKLEEGVHILKENFEYGDLGMIDGHSRLKLSKRLHFKQVPLQLFPYRSKNMIIGTWLKNYKPLSRQEVLKHFKKKDSFVESKATKHTIRGKDGKAYKLSLLQPRVVIGTNQLKQSS